MGFVDAIWHLLNLFGPAAGMALMAPTLAKLLWRRALRPVAWHSLAGWTFAACAAVLGFGVIAGGAALLAKVAVFVFLVLFVVSLVVGRRLR